MIFYTSNWLPTTLLLAIGHLSQISVISMQCAADSRTSGFWASFRPYAENKSSEKRTERGVEGGAL